jgi:hypothetical protein
VRVFGHYAELEVFTLVDALSVSKLNYIKDYTRHKDMENYLPLLELPESLPAFPDL